MNKETNSGSGRRSAWTDPVRELFLHKCAECGEFKPALAALIGHADIDGNKRLNYDTLMYEFRKNPDFHEDCITACQSYFIANAVEDSEALRPHIKFLLNDAYIWEDMPDPDNPGETERVVTGTKLKAAEINSLASAISKISRQPTHQIKPETEDRTEEADMELSEDQVMMIGDQIQKILQQAEPSKKDAVA